MRMVQTYCLSPSPLLLLLSGVYDGVGTYNKTIIENWYVDDDDDVPVPVPILSHNDMYCTFVPSSFVFIGVGGDIYIYIYIYMGTICSWYYIMMVWCCVVLVCIIEYRHPALSTLCPVSFYPQRIMTICWYYSYCLFVVYLYVYIVCFSPTSYSYIVWPNNENSRTNNNTLSHSPSPSSVVVDSYMWLCSVRTRNVNNGLVCLSMIDDARVQYVYVGCSAMNNVSSDGNHRNDNNTTISSSLLLLLLLHSD